MLQKISTLISCTQMLITAPGPAPILFYVTRYCRASLHIKHWSAYWPRCRIWILHFVFHCLTSKLFWCILLKFRPFQSIGCPSKLDFSLLLCTTTLQKITLRISPSPPCSQCRDYFCSWQNHFWPEQNVWTCLSVFSAGPLPASQVRVPASSTVRIGLDRESFGRQEIGQRSSRRSCHRRRRRRRNFSRRGKNLILPATSAQHFK